MPMVGFGTWKLRGGEARDAVLAALAAGYRHIDTATMYGNEAEVGQALARQRPRPGRGLRHDEDPPVRRRAGTRQCSTSRCARCGTDYLDLWLIHWPPSQQGREPPALERAAGAPGRRPGQGRRREQLQPDGDRRADPAIRPGSRGQPDRLGPDPLRRRRARRARRARDRGRGLQLAQEHQPRRSGAGEDRSRARRDAGPGRAALAPRARRHRHPEVGAAGADRGEP